MKRIIVLISLIILIISFNVSAATNPYKEKITLDGSTYITNCTWYAWKMAYEKAGVVLPGFGNAKNWYSDAKKAGFSVGTTPKANSIVVWENMSSYGHVGYVESVDGDTLKVWDSQECYDEQTEIEHWNCIKLNTTSADDSYKCDYIYSEDKRVACTYSINSSYTITGYIYLDEPRKTTSTTSKSNTTTTKKEEVVTKSSNNYLNNLTISGTNIEFNKDTLEYNLEVLYEIDNILINATLEDSKSSIEGIGLKKLNVGENSFIIKVTAEDTSTKEYKINIIRKEEVIKEREEIEVIKEDNITEESNLNYYIIGIVSILIVIIISIVLIRYKK